MAIEACGNQIESTPSLTAPTYVIKQRVLVFPLVLEELVEAVRLEDALRLVREEHGVSVERHPQLRLRHLRKLL